MSGMKVPAGFCIMRNGLALAVVLVALGADYPAWGQSDSARLDAIAERGAQVMPFALDKTLHVFTPTDQGGVQEVIARQPDDREQITLIRQHLAEIAAAFSRGDFSGPISIHGETMPGLAALRSGGKSLRIEYRELPNGGRIDYLAATPELISAIHQFFAAQLNDHARHAISGHAGHHP